MWSILTILWDVKDRCDIRDKLFSAYRQAVKDWVAAMNDDQSDERIEEKRFQVVCGRNLYENHCVSHKCGVLPGPARQNLLGRVS